mgnify:CR=1 FL=1
MLSAQEHEQERNGHVSGHVKWFDPARGFGFVEVDDGGPDVLLHANVLRNFGQSSVADGVAVDVIAQKTERGMQAVEVIRILPPEDPGPTGLEDIDTLPAEVVMASPLHPARVKWFDRVKGFGFANIFGCARDVFLHIEVLRQSGFSELDPGEAVGLRIVEAQRGLMAVRVSPWEMAVEQRGTSAASD